MRYLLFWDVTCIGTYRRFGIFNGQAVQPTGCPDTSLNNYQSSPRNIPEERRSHICTYIHTNTHTYIHTYVHTHTHIYIVHTHVHTHTGCHRRKGPNFGRVFLMLNYTDITQNTYIQSWTVTEIMVREVWNFDSCYTLTDCQIHIETGRNMWFL